jgi:competence protein ComFC
MRSISSLLSIILPESCVLCGESLEYRFRKNYPVCSSCMAAIVPLSGDNRCCRCGIDLVSEHLICTRCRDSDYCFDSNIPLFRYSGSTRELLYQYKFKKRRRLAWLFAEFLEPVIAGRYPGRIVVPVPSNRTARSRRGFDHIMEIALILDRRFGLPVRTIITNTARTQQKGLGFDERIENLKGKIGLIGRGPVPQTPEAVVLLDDVFTTGATVSECARVLKSSGIGHVDVVTIAID